MATVVIGLLWVAIRSGLGPGAAEHDPGGADVRTEVVKVAVEALGRIRAAVESQTKESATPGAQPHAEGATNRATGSGCYWWDEARRNKTDLGFLLRAGSLPENRLWRHELLNPQDRAPCSGDIADFERLCGALERAMRPIVSEAAAIEMAERIA